jgi:hypothetical protein
MKTCGVMMIVFVWPSLVMGYAERINEKLASFIHSFIHQPKNSSAIQ